MGKITRRSFSKLSAGAAVAMAGIKGSSAAIRASSISPNDRLTVGLIGAGGMGMGDLRDMLRIPWTPPFWYWSVTAKKWQA